MQLHVPDQQLELSLIWQARLDLIVNCSTAARWHLAVSLFMMHYQRHIMFQGESDSTQQSS